jgi:hypothetical protein
LVLLQAGIVAKTVGGSTDSLQKNKAQNTVSTDFCTPTKRPASKGPGIKGPATKDPEVRSGYTIISRRKKYSSFITGV